MKAQNIMRSLVIAIILAAGIAQVQAVNYRNSYRKPTPVPSLKGGGISQGAVAPAATFRSTSAFSSPEWAEQSATPMLNNDGSVDEGAYMGGPRRLGEGPSPGSGTQPGTPGNPEDENQQPLGDAALPLMLLACAYAIYKVSRRRKEA